MSPHHDSQTHHLEMIREKNAMSHNITICKHAQSKQSGGLMAYRVMKWGTGSHKRPGGMIRELRGGRGQNPFPSSGEIQPSLWLRKFF